MSKNKNSIQPLPNLAANAVLMVEGEKVNGGRFWKQILLYKRQSFLPSLD